MHQWGRVSWFKGREQKNDRGRLGITLVEIVKKYMSIKEVRLYDFG